MEHFTRYANFVYDGDSRTVEGIAVRYGEEAMLFPGVYDTLEPGAFGADINAQDVVLNIQHDRGRPVARTGGAGLSFEDGPIELKVKAALIDTMEGNDALKNVRGKILRGFSLEYRVDPTTTSARKEIRKGREVTVFTAKKAELKGIALVDSPAYNSSKILNAAMRHAEKLQTQESETMDEHTIAKAIREAMSEKAERPEDAAKEIHELVRAEIRTAFEQRDQAIAEKAAADEKAELERKAAEQAAMDATAAAETRAEIIVLTKPFLKEDADIRKMSNRDLLVAAVGDEVKNVESRGDEYLVAKVESIAERRAAAQTGTKTAGHPNPGALDTPEYNGIFGFMRSEERV